MCISAADDGGLIFVWCAFCAAKRHSGLHSRARALRALRTHSYMLFVTLRRGLAGKQQTYLKTLKSLGLRKPRQEVELANNAATRGQIEKVKHLVSVETAPQREERLAALAKKLAPREPVIVNH